MVFRRKPRNEAKPKAKSDDKDAPKEPSPDAPRMINGVRVAKASTIVREGL